MGKNRHMEGYWIVCRQYCSRNNEMRQQLFQFMEQPQMYSQLAQTAQA